MNGGENEWSSPISTNATLIMADLFAGMEELTDMIGEHHIQGCSKEANNVVVSNYESRWYNRLNARITGNEYF